MAKDRRKLQHIHSSIVDKQPTAASLEVGEIAVNNAATQEFLSIKNSEDKVVRFSTDSKIIEWVEKKEVMPYSGTVDNVHLDTNRSNIEIKLNQVAAHNTAKYDVVNGATDIDGEAVNPSSDGGLTNGAGFAIDMSRYAMIGANPSFSSVTVTHQSNLSGTTNISNGASGSKLNITTTNVEATNTNWTETITNKTSTTNTAQTNITNKLTENIKVKETVIGTDDLTVSGTTTINRKGAVSENNHSTKTVYTSGNVVTNTTGTTTSTNGGDVTENNLSDKTVNTSGDIVINTTGTTTSTNVGNVIENNSSSKTINTIGDVIEATTGSTTISRGGSVIETDSNNVTHNIESAYTLTADSITESATNSITLSSNSNVITAASNNEIKAPSNVISGSTTNVTGSTSLGLKGETINQSGTTTNVTGSTALNLSGNTINTNALTSNTTADSAYTNVSTATTVVSDLSVSATTTDYSGNTLSVTESESISETSPNTTIVGSTTLKMSGSTITQSGTTTNIYGSSELNLTGTTVTQTGTTVNVKGGTVGISGGTTNISGGTLTLSGGTITYYRNSTDTISSTTVDDALEETLSRSKVTMTKETPEATSEILATYKLYQNGSQIGDDINIPKDHLLRNADIVYGKADGGDFTACTEASSDCHWYIKLIWNVYDPSTGHADDKVTYMPADDFIKDIDDSNPSDTGSAANHNVVVDVWYDGQSNKISASTTPTMNVTNLYASNAITATSISGTTINGNDISGTNGTFDNLTATTANITTLTASDTTINGAATINSTLTVTGDTTLANVTATTVSATTSVTSPSLSGTNGTFDNLTATTANLSSITSNNITNSNDITTSTANIATLTAGDTTITGATTINSTLTVTGDTTLANVTATTVSATTSISVPSVNTTNISTTNITADSASLSSVTSNTISTNSITSDSANLSSITSNNISNSNNITTNTVSADTVSVTTISATTVSVTTISADSIDVSNGLGESLTWSLGTPSANTSGYNGSETMNIVIPSSITNLSEYESSTSNLDLSDKNIKASGGTFSSTVSSTGFYQTSDIRFKKNIENADLTKCINAHKVPIKQFNYIDNESNRLVYGIIAQDAELSGIEEIVYTDVNGKKSVDYTSLTMLKMAYLEIENKLLKNKVDEISDKLDELLNKSNS